MGRNFGIWLIEGVNLDFDVNGVKKAIIYIEDHLKERLCAEDVAKCVNLSYYHFHRIFYVWTGETLGDYIRKRRLTQAACELLSTNKRIIDIALDYVFESQAAFCRSFKNVYGVPPSVFRSRGLRPAIFDKNSLLGDRLKHRVRDVTINPEIFYLSVPIKIIGVKGKTSLKNNMIPKLWETFRKRRDEIKNVVSPGKSYGVCPMEVNFNLHDFTVDMEYAEIAGLEVGNFADVPPGMVTHIIKPGCYAVFKHIGKISELRFTYDYIWGTWVPNTSYQLDMRDDFELYGDDFYGLDSDQSVVRIYLPLKTP